MTRDDDEPITRSDQRIPKLRTRGRANREKLLREGQLLLQRAAGDPIRFSDVFAAAGVSRGSAYRLYNGIDDLMQDLASHWITDFAAHVKAAASSARPESWSQLSDQMLLASAEYWADTADILKLLPRVRSNAPESYEVAVRDLTTTVASIFEHHFVVPRIADWLSVLAMYAQLGDVVFVDAVHRDGRISEQRLCEAQTLCRTYLSFYLPASLPARAC